MADESNNESDEEKSEEPSQRKLDKAKEEGNVVFSKEIVTLSLLIGCAVCLLFVLPWSSKSFSKNLSVFISFSDQFSIDGNMVNSLFWQASKISFLFLIPTFLVLLIMVLSSGLYQKWGAFSLKPLKPALNKISLQKGFKKIFSKQNLVENFKNWVKLTCLSAAIYFALINEKIEIPRWMWITSVDFFKILWDFNYTIYFTMIIVFGCIAIFDYIFQRFEFMKKMRMSKYDLKQEYKEAEGSPEIKSKIRQMRFAQLQNRMMDKVPTATVVLANPTHFAIALLWDDNTMNAPVVVAKGQDFIAQKIKEIAKKNDVPVIENPSLTRALFDVVDLEDEIPPKFYKAVAEVIRLVTRLKNRYFK
ncbi:MAG: flagellar biosynthesis protein FlhB [Proteobacteria bacterium]|nr:flagellar biosynthesis protein FlhB [Pseudomonadota bacterium]